MPAERKDRALLKAVRQRRIICAVLLLLAVYFTASVISLRVRIAGEQRELGELSRKAEEQQLQNEELSRVIYSDGERDYIERIAREKLDYVAIDERIFVDLAGS